MPLGEFAIDMKKFEGRPGDKVGETGTVKFTPGAKAPDSTSIRLTQIVKVDRAAVLRRPRAAPRDLRQEQVGPDVEQARRQDRRRRRAHHPGVDRGRFFVDHKAGDPKAKVRSSKAKPNVPQDYVWRGEESPPKNQHGAKAGTTIVPASLDDTPGSDTPDH